MTVELKSTKAKVQNAEKMRKILDSYALRGVDIHLSEESGEWTLSMAFTEPEDDLNESPQALHRNQWPDEEQPAGEEEEDLQETEWDKRFEDKGAEGFIALLRELAPYLETPLLILSLLRDAFLDDLIEAEAWCIHPGSKEVVTLCVRR